MIALAALQRSPASDPFVEWLRFLPYPFIWVIALPAIILAWLHRGWLSRGLALAGLVAALLIPDPRWAWPGIPSAAADPPGLRLMTYNVKAFLEWSEPGHMQRIAAEIRGQRPDIVMLQDAVELAEALRRGLLRREAFGLGPAPTIHSFGQYVVLSRWPLRDCHAPALDARAGADYLQCIVQVPELGEMPVVALHLLTPRAGLNAVRHQPRRAHAWDVWRENFGVRLAEARQIASDLGDLPPDLRQRLLVGGDFNAVAASPVLRTFRDQGLADAYDRAGRGLGHTIGHALRIGVDLLRIDHLLAGSCWTPHSAHVGARDISEHRAVIADLRWNGSCEAARS